MPEVIALGGDGARKAREEREAHPGSQRPAALGRGNCGKFRLAGKGRHSY